MQVYKFCLEKNFLCVYLGMICFYRFVIITANFVKIPDLLPTCFLLYLGHLLGGFLLAECFYNGL